MTQDETQKLAVSKSEEKLPDFSHWILVLSRVLSAVSCGVCLACASETNSTYTWKPTTSEITYENSCTVCYLVSEEHDKCSLIWNCISLLPFLGNPCYRNLWTPKGTKSNVFLSVESSLLAKSSFKSLFLSCANCTLWYFCSFILSCLILLLFIYGP